MAVFRSLIAASLLSSAVLAIPMVDKREIYTHTETQIAWITVEETTTIWVDPAQATLPVEGAPPVEATTTTPPAGVFAQTYAPTTFATQVANVDTTSSIPEAPAVAPATPAPAPAPEPSSVPVQPKDTAGSPSASCEGLGDSCVGDVTYWDGGLGACGWNVDTKAEMVIALPHGFMGTQSNGNPYCGRAVTLVNPTSGTTVQATVGDKCMGCVDRAIDCTSALFNAITDGKGDGRMSGIQWYFS